MKKLTAAVYIRTSTREGRQHGDNQRAAIRELAERQGWTIAAEFRDEASGGKSADQRPELASMLRQLQRRHFDLVIVWALDRLTRQGPIEAFKLIEQFRHAGADLVSVQEPHFSTTGPAGDLFIAVAAWIARQERERMSERIRAGLGRARAAGKKPGPAKKELTPEQAALIASEKHTVAELARVTGLSRATIFRRRNDIKKSNSHTAPQKREPAK